MTRRCITMETEMLSQGYCDVIYLITVGHEHHLEGMSLAFQSPAETAGI